jgi:protein arginine kinase activator
MFCEKCGKNPAVIHRITTINGKKQEVHLCKECAMHEKFMFIDDTFSINALLSSLLDMGMDTPIKIEKLEGLKCSQCGQSFGEFRQTGKLGCDLCYHSYRDRLIPLLKRVQGNVQHSGKVPRRVWSSLRTKKEIDKLKEELERAVKAEEYERAADLRDRIKSIGGANK